MSGHRVTLSRRAREFVHSLVRLAAEPDEQRLLECVVELCARFTGANRAVAVLLAPPNPDLSGPLEVARVSELGMPGVGAVLMPRRAAHSARFGVLGEVVRQSTAIRVDRLTDHPGAAGTVFADLAPASFLGVPIRDEGRVVGALCLVRPVEGGAFDAADQALVESAAAQAGVALGRVRAAERARDLAQRLAVAGRLQDHAIGDLTDELEPQQAIARILAAAQSGLDMDLSFVSRVTPDEQHYDFVSAAGPAFGMPAGLVRPAESGYCRSMLAGQLPAVVLDTTRDPVAARLASTVHDGVRAYAGVPLRLPDGELYGTLCAVSASPRPRLGSADEALLRLLATLVGHQLGRLQQRRRDQLAAVQRVHDRIDAGPVTVVAQPIVNLRTGGVAGVEALARFADDAGGPAAVFADASALGMGVELELAALAAALTLLPRLPPPMYLSVNASAATVLDPRLGDLLAQCAAGRVVLELTEHSRVTDYAALTAALTRLRARGIRLAVDDAGSGYSSLRHVLTLLPDVIKLDIDLIRGVNADPARRALVVSMVSFATELGATLVAEGIETAAELATLQQLGVSHGQGFHLGRPAPLATVALTAGSYLGSERRGRNRPWSARISPEALDAVDAPEALDAAAAASPGRVSAPGPGTRRWPAAG